MAGKIDKIVLTHNTALQQKYGASGTRRIHSGIRGLIRADRNRGLITRVIALDDAATMRMLDGALVSFARLQNR